MENKSPPAIQPILRPGVLPLTPEKEEAQRALVISEARSWINTPYRHLAGKKGVGVDCAMLLVRCWIDAGIFEEFDPRPYPPHWHLHRSTERYLDWMQSLATEVSEGKPGDVVVYKVGRCYSHSGIISRPGYVIHSFARIDACMETEMRSGYLVKYPDPKYFDLWEKHR